MIFSFIAVSTIFFVFGFGKKIGKILESSFSIVKLTNFANFGEEFVKF